MRRKEIILFMTTGTGINSDNSDEGDKQLAKKLYSTINKIYPNKVVFFASNISKQTIPYIEELFKKDNDEFISGEDYEIVTVEAIDDFSSCFEIFESKILQYDYMDDKDYQIIMDYTSGTKTMSAAMACCGMFYLKDLVSVGGDRRNGQVSAGTEIINYQNLYKIYDKFALMRTRRNFNSHRFMPCIDILNYIVDLNIHKDSFLNLCKAYYYWDNMAFEHAYNHLKEVDTKAMEFVEIRKRTEDEPEGTGQYC